LQGENLDLTLTGFSMDKIGDMLGETAADGIEDAPSRSMSGYHRARP